MDGENVPSGQRYTKIYHRYKISQRSKLNKDDFTRRFSDYKVCSDLAFFVGGCTMVKVGHGVSTTRFAYSIEQVLVVTHVRALIA